MTRVVMVCAKCGGQNVLADAYCSWNVEEQQWEIAGTFDKGALCEYCDGPCRIEERELPATSSNALADADR